MIRIAQKLNITIDHLINKNITEQQEYELAKKKWEKFNYSIIQDNDKILIVPFDYDLKPNSNILDYDRQVTLELSSKEEFIRLTNEIENSIRMDSAKFNHIQFKNRADDITSALTRKLLEKGITTLEECAKGEVFKHLTFEFFYNMEV